nr:glutamate receptor ionotropic, delta-2-like [Penaeus vannamei]
MNEEVRRASAYAHHMEEMLYKIQAFCRQMKFLIRLPDMTDPSSRTTTGNIWKRIMKTKGGKETQRDLISSLKAIFLFKYLIIGSSKSELQALSSTKKGRKTEELAGVVKYPKRGVWGIYCNQVVWAQGVKRLTTWQGGKFTTTTPLYPDLLNDLRGAPLTVVTFPWEPSVIYKEDKKDGTPVRYGRDIRVVETLAKVMNFTLAYTEPPEGELWGNKLENGSWTGLFGFLERGDADIGVGNTFVSNVNGRMDVAEFSSPYDADVSCFLGTRPPPLPRWQRILYPFQLSTWVAFLVGLLLSGPILCFLARVWDVRNEEHRGLKSFLYASLYTFGLHLRESQAYLPSRRSTQVFVSFLWLYTIIIITAYCSNLTAFLTVARQPPSIDTVKGLYASGLNVAGLGYFFGKALELSSNQYLRGLAERYEVHTRYEDIWTVVRRGTAVNLESRKTLQYLVTTQLTSRGATSMRIIKECFFPSRDRSDCPARVSPQEEVRHVGLADGGSWTHRALVPGLAQDSQEGRSGEKQQREKRRRGRNRDRGRGRRASGGHRSSIPFH